MCQLLGLSSSDPIRLTFDWDSFAMRGSQQGGNPDGWGVAYYEGVDAMLLREPAPAAESSMVQFLSSHAPRSNLVISHVRRAPPMASGNSPTRNHFSACSEVIHTPSRITGSYHHQECRAHPAG
jgi:glutamine amidotransferase